MTEKKYFLLTHIPIVGSLLRNRIDGVWCSSVFDNMTSEQISKYSLFVNDFRKKNPKQHMDKKIIENIIKKANEPV